MSSPPFFPVLHCPLGLDEHQACPFPDVVFPPLFMSALSSSLFHCALQDDFGQTWWTGDVSTPLQFASLYDGLTTTAFITAEGARACPLCRRPLGSGGVKLSFFSPFIGTGLSSGGSAVTYSIKRSWKVLAIAICLFGQSLVTACTHESRHCLSCFESRFLLNSQCQYSLHLERQVFQYWCCDE